MKPRIRDLAALVVVLVVARGLSAEQSMYFGAQCENRETPLQLEHRVSPYFEARVSSVQSLGKRVAATPPTHADLIALAKQWSKLSAEFKQTYLEAVSIPTGFDMHISPGGNFEIYYTTTDTHAVDSTDTMGTNPLSWRTRTAGANGVPDYIDDVAWALDSAWSMEIDRFGFHQPYGYKDYQYSSERYKVVIRELDAVFYGKTYGVGYVTDQDSLGFRSIFELRNHWRGWNTDVTDYETHPEKGIRITCAHELFHGIQFSSVWEVTSPGPYMDDFPISWQEATASAMEEIAHGHVNDWHQYAVDYFVDPTISLLHHTPYETLRYASVPLLIYLSTVGGVDSGMQFVRRMYENNADTVTPFHQNVVQCIAATGKTWAKALNEFHAASYFCGVREGSTGFIDDSNLLPAWAHAIDDTLGDSTVVKSVKPYGMQTFTYRSNAGADTLVVNIQTLQPDSSEFVPDWAASLIVTSGSTADSLVPLALNNTGAVTHILAPASRIGQAIVVVTNGHHDSTLSASVSFTAKGVIPDTIGVSPGIAGAANALGTMQVSFYLLSGRLVGSARVDQHSPSNLNALARQIGLPKATYVAFVNNLSKRASSTRMCIFSR